MSINAKLQKPQVKRQLSHLSRKSISISHRDFVVMQSISVHIHSSMDSVKIFRFKTFWVRIIWTENLASV